MSIDQTDEGVAELQRPGPLYFAGRILMAPLLKLVYRPRVIGRRNVPKHGKVILASNHLSFIDSVVIPMTAPRRVQFLAKSSYFEGTGVKGRISRAFFTAIGAVGVKRGAGAAAQEALDQSRRIIDTGAAFALYPVLLPSSTEAARGLTIHQAASDGPTLKVALGWWIVGLVLVAASFRYLYGQFRGKVAAPGPGQDPEHDTH